MKRRKRSKSVSSLKARATKLRLYLERRLIRATSETEKRRIIKHLKKVYRFPTQTHWSDT